MNLYTFIREKIGLKEISNVLESLHRIQIHKLTMERQAAANESDRFKWIASYVEKGHTERAVKLLDDLCYDVGNYQDEAVAKFLKGQCQKMNWLWAVDLMELRSFS